MFATLMDSMPATRSSAPTPRLLSVSRAPRRVRSNPSSSRLASCLRRCAAAGFRFVVTAPANAAVFGRGLGRFPERCINPAEHVQWETAYRLFSSSGRQPHDRGSWRILAVDHDDRVVGAITARFFCGDVVRDYFHVLSLLDTTGPVFREHCELAVTEMVTNATQANRTPAEISHWAVVPCWHAPLLAVTLMRAMAGLAAAFDSPLIVLAADNRRGEVNRLMRLGSAPLGLAGRFCLPPFVHHASGAWLRLLLLDAPTFQARSGSTPAADLALLREQLPIISVA